MKLELIVLFPLLATHTTPRRLLSPCLSLSLSFSAPCVLADFQFLLHLLNLLLPLLPLKLESFVL